MEKGQEVKFDVIFLSYDEPLAEEHWKWIEELWAAMPEGTVFGLEATEYLYKTAFVHGWKHAEATKVRLSPGDGDKR